MKKTILLLVGILILLSSCTPVDNMQKKQTTQELTWYEVTPKHEVNYDSYNIHNDDELFSLMYETIQNIDER